MTRTIVNPGVCGLLTEIAVEKKSGKTYFLTVRSDCEMVRKLGEQMPELGMMDVFKKLLDTPVYKLGSVCLKHVSCAVPCGILKTLEVEAGLAVARDVSISFKKD